MNRKIINAGFAIAIASCLQAGTAQFHPGAMRSGKPVEHAVPFLPGDPLDRAIVAGRDWLMEQVKAGKYGVNPNPKRPGKGPAEAEKERMDREMVALSLAAQVMVQCGNTLRFGKHKSQLLSTLRPLARCHGITYKGLVHPFAERSHFAKAMVLAAYSQVGGYSAYLVPVALARRLAGAAWFTSATGPDRDERMVWSLLAAQAMGGFPKFYGEETATQKAYFSSWLRSGQKVAAGSVARSRISLVNDTVALARLYFRETRLGIASPSAAVKALEVLKRIRQPGGGLSRPWECWFAISLLARGDRAGWLQGRQMLMDHLLPRQINKGDAKGSWAPEGGWSTRYGSVCHTAMSVLLLLHCRECPPHTFLVYQGRGWSDMLLGPDTIPIPLILVMGRSTGAPESTSFLFDGKTYPHRPALLTALAAALKIKRSPEMSLRLDIVPYPPATMSDVMSLVNAARGLGYKNFTFRIPGGPSWRNW